MFRVKLSRSGGLRFWYVVRSLLAGGIIGAVLVERKKVVIGDVTVLFPI